MIMIRISRQIMNCEPVGEWQLQLPPSPALSSIFQGGDGSEPKCARLQVRRWIDLLQPKAFVSCLCEKTCVCCGAIVW